MINGSIVDISDYSMFLDLVMKEDIEIFPGINSGELSYMFDNFELHLIRIMDDFGDLTDRWISSPEFYNLEMFLEDLEMTA